MGFSMAQYQAAISGLTAGIQDLSGKLQQIGPAAQAAANHWYIPPSVADDIIWLANKMIDLGSKLLDKIIELLKGAVAPIYMFQYSWDWQDIRGHATGISSQLKPDGLSVDVHWQGAAADAYVKSIKPQSEAAARVGQIAERTAASLTLCATAALAFYLALGVILVKFIAATITAIVAFGTAVLCWAGAALIVEEAGVNTALIITAVGALLAVLGAQAKEMAVLHGEATDSTAFPGHEWPTASTTRFSDATVADGDAEWSFQR